MDIYLWTGRLISKEEIDREFDRVVNPEKHKRKEIRKEILQSLAGGLIGGAIAVAIILGATKYIELPEKPVKSEKITPAKTQSTNPVATAAYNKELQNKK